MIKFLKAFAPESGRTLTKAAAEAARRTRLRGFEIIKGRDS